MTRERPYLFLILDLLQDVNILWPLARLAAEETCYQIGLLVSDRFINRDSKRIWEAEVADLARSIRAEIHIFDSEFAAYQVLQDKRGVIIAGSESNLGAHATSHNIFRTAPASFLRVTLQHGFECVGFLQNREQSMVHGEDIRFGSDILCSWMGPEKLAHLHPSERPKLYVSGPSALIGRRKSENTTVAAARQAGLVCENLHSVRMNAAGDFKGDYMATFFAFSAAMARRGRQVALRPHPGGQYVVRNGIELPRNVVLNNEPMFKIDLSQYAYGISAPSSVLIDMILAGIPTAVWQDEGEVIDAGNYKGLTRISSLEDWLAFAEAAIADPAPFLERQRAFLEQTGILVEPDEVRARFLRLLEAGDIAANEEANDQRRVLYVANADIPTLQLSFTKPFQPLVEEGTIAPLLITEAEIRRKMGKKADEQAGWEWIAEQIDQFRPDVAVFCRYSGPLASRIIDFLRKHDVPVIFHIDDDLLNVPPEIGEAKFKDHNRPERLDTVSTLLRRADLVYCSTDPLKQRFNELGFIGNLRHGKIYCSGNVLAPAVNRPVRKIGYMGFDHAYDLDMALPEILQFLRERRDIQFELFGSIPKPSELEEFGDRITVIPPVRPYESFLDHFATLEWDIGICPLANTGFNAVKANTKWVEYSSVGAAVIATSGMAYDDCCSDDCGILIDGAIGWREALHALCDDPHRRYRMVVNAQEKIQREYSIVQLRRQVLAMFDLAQKEMQQSIARVAA
jgi:hypothetical protein